MPPKKTTSKPPARPLAQLQPAPQCLRCVHVYLILETFLVKFGDESAPGWLSDAIERQIPDHKCGEIVRKYEKLAGRIIGQPVGAGGNEAQVQKLDLGGRDDATGEIREGSSGAEAPDANAPDACEPPGGEYPSGS